MAFAATGFWSAFLFRVLAGVGWAGTYMVGLKALADQVEGASQSRAVAFHVASIGISGSLSFVIAGVVATWLNWQAAFIAGALSTLGALVAAAWGFSSPEPGAQKRLRYPTTGSSSIRAHVLAAINWKESCYGL